MSTFFVCSSQAKILRILESQQVLAKKNKFFKENLGFKVENATIGAIMIGDYLFRIRKFIRNINDLFVNNKVQNLYDTILL
uniref:Uncharacterized protein n=1 Tax=Meloidogyne enterolobii TaxID=390850 RepID=A0A6V7UCT2_MELEN|nr:unnamed protein product [Meloidogyne enterolobii]